jgi:hypothetical protein
MFVPSRSWQNDHFYIEKRLKGARISYRWRFVTRPYQSEIHLWDGLVLHLCETLFC